MIDVWGRGDRESSASEEEKQQEARGDWQTRGKQDNPDWSVLPAHGKKKT